jgi:hypothetical protein
MLDRVVEAQTRSQVPTFERVPLQLRVHAGETSIDFELCRFIDWQRVRVRSIAAVGKHCVLEVVARLLSLAVQPIDACKPLQLRAVAYREVRIEVDIVGVDDLPETIGIGCESVLGELLAQETASVAYARVRNGERARQAPTRVFARKPEGQLSPVLILACVGRIDIGIERKSIGQDVALTRVWAVGILTQRSNVDIGVQLAN